MGGEGDVLLGAWQNGVLSFISLPKIVLKIKAEKPPAGCHAHAGQKAKGLALSHFTNIGL